MPRTVGVVFGLSILFTIITRDSTGANNSDFQTTFSTVLSDGVYNSRFSCSSLACNQEVMSTASKTKNFSLFVREGFAHDFKPR